jgi:hypothetical protein
LPQLEEELFQIENLGQRLEYNRLIQQLASDSTAPKLPFWEATIKLTNDIGKNGQLLLLFGDQPGNFYYPSKILNLNTSLEFVARQLQR